jgi:ribosomal protein S18 acetylase RimI-like enzyme
VDALELRSRATTTLLAAWEAYARGRSGAAVLRRPGVAVAVFPEGPEREVYNNAVLAGGLDRDGRERAIAAMEGAYRRAGVVRFAAWTHDEDPAMQAALGARGYTLAETTRAMSAVLAELPSLRPTVELEPIGWPEYLSYLVAAGLPGGLLEGTDPRAFHLLAARHDGAIVATGLAHEAGGDCGIYNISTLPAVRRRGLATAVTAGLVQAARSRGCTTASLQASPMAEGLYTRLGFRDLGRILEYAPPGDEERRRP